MILWSGHPSLKKEGKLVYPKLFKLTAMLGAGVKQVDFSMSSESVKVELLNKQKELSNRMIMSFNG
jgi:hypothetical protein